MDRVAEMELLVQVAERGNLSRAAEFLDIPLSSASRAMGALEHRLGVRLVDRNPRSMTLTDLGRDFYQRCKQILLEMQNAEAAMQAKKLKPSGTLRVTASLSFCLKHISPILPKFTSLYPDIDLQLITANRYHDLVDNGIDVAIRTRDYEKDVDITSRKLAEARYLIAGSPAYFARHGKPSVPSDLRQHAMLVYSHAKDPHQLCLTKAGQTLAVRVKSLMEANDGQLLRAGCMDGLGLVVQPNYVIADDVATGALVPVMLDWTLPSFPINVAYQSRNFLPSKTRVFVDFLFEHFREMDFERRWQLASRVTMAVQL